MTANVDDSDSHTDNDTILIVNSMVNKYTAWRLKMNKKIVTDLIDIHQRLHISHNDKSDIQYLNKSLTSSQALMNSLKMSVSAVTF